MTENRIEPGRSALSYTIPAAGTHNTIPPFTTAMDRGVEVQLRAVTITGAQPGPRLYLGGGIHGDEVNGIEAAWRVARELDPARLRGSITVVPVQNPAAFRFRSRLNPFDPIDPDWVHPPDPNSSPGGSYTRRLKGLLHELAANADCVVDLHTAGLGGGEQPGGHRAVPDGERGGEALAGAGAGLRGPDRARGGGWKTTAGRSGTCSPSSPPEKEEPCAAETMRLFSKTENYIKP